MTTRQTHSLELKRSAGKASDEPGASIAGVAMTSVINANQLHARRRLPFLAGSPKVAEPQHLHVTITPESLPSKPLHKP